MILIFLHYQNIALKLINPLYKEKRPSLDEGYFDPTVYNGRKRPSERVTTMNDGRDKQWKESLSIDTCCHEGEEK